MYVSAREEQYARDERESERAARRVEGSLPKQASVVELNKRRSYQFIMGRHVAHARAYGALPFLSRYITACTRVALENRCTLTISPVPAHHQRPSPSGRPHPAVSPPPVISVRLFISLAPSRRLPFVSRFSLYSSLLHYVSPPLFAALRYEGTN